MDNKIYIENTSLAYLILRELINLNLRTGMFPFYSEFTKQELDKIENLSITSYVTLDDIEKISNLKSLSILGDTEDREDNKYWKIGELTNLEKLQIVNVENIYELDLSKLVNLRSLKLINNCNLNSLTGIDKPLNLKEIIIGGNDLKEVDNIIKYIENTSDAKINILDVNMFDTLFGKNIKNRKFLESKINSQWSNITFGEMLSFDNECYTLEYYQMLKMYSKAASIITRLKLNDDTDIEKTRKIYKYIVDNLTYNYSGLETRDEMYSKKELYYKDNDYFKRRMLSINSSYSAIMEKKSVCDGYVNMMKLLLNMCGIESRKVLCSLYDAYPTKSDHVIIKVNIDGEWLYADPEKEQSTQSMDYFLLSIDEIQKTHFLSIKEKEENSNPKIYRKK